MNSDFKDLLRSFLNFQVRFLVAGGVAVIKYTEPRYTKDLDIWIDNSSENAKRVITALAEFGAPLNDIKYEDFTTEDGFFQIGIAPNRIDIINQIPGVEFSSCFERREDVLIDNMKVPFISRQDLIAAKLAAGRPHDLVDAGALAKVGSKVAKNK